VYCNRNIYIVEVNYISKCTIQNLKLITKWILNYIQLILNLKILIMFILLNEFKITKLSVL